MSKLEKNFKEIFSRMKLGANILLVGSNNSGKSVVFNELKALTQRAIEADGYDVVLRGVELQSDTDLMVWKEERLAILFADLDTAYKSQKFLESDFNVCKSMCSEGYLSVVTTLYPINIDNYLTPTAWNSSLIQELLTSYGFSSEFKNYLRLRPLLVVLTDSNGSDIVVYIDNLTYKGEVIFIS